MLDEFHEYGVATNISTFRGQMQRATFFTRKCSQTLENDKKAVSSVSLRMAEKLIQPIIQNFRNEKTVLIERKNKLAAKSRIKALKRIVYRLASLELFGLTLEDIKERQPFPKDPFQGKHALSFIRAVKLGDIDQVQRMLSSNRYLVYEYDLVHNS